MATQKIYLNNDWGFCEVFEEEMLMPDYSGEKLERVRLPHTCKETPFHYFDENLYQMICGYRRELFAPVEWEGKQVLLTFEGVGHVSEVYLNGQKVGEHRCGYTAFTVDLSEGLVYGTANSLVVKVNSREDSNVPPFGFVIDYMTYGGIYREVYLEIKNADNLADVFVRSELLEGGKSAKLISQVTLSQDIVRVADMVEDAAQEETGKSEVTQSSIKQYIRKHGETEYSYLGEATVTGKLQNCDFTVEDVALWDVENPNLYDISTQLWSGEVLLDEKVISFGFRSAEFKEDGFYLNGKKLRIRGLNRHQSYPYVGYAAPKAMQEFDADVLKRELGLNAVRTSHYPQSHHFLNHCDEIGLLVFTEIPGWQHIGDAQWKEQAVENVKDMVRQYRNHTSIILWGVRINESQDDDEFYIRTNAAARELDPSRPTGGVRNMKKSHLFEDVYTYNDFIHCGDNRGCDPKKAVTSDKTKPYLVSEYNGHMFPTKSFDCEEHRVEHAMRHANVLDAVAGEEGIAGSFGWCMADYNTHKDFGSGDRICYHGVLDMFRNAKLAASIYACQQEKETILELSSAMDIGEHPGCTRGSTYIYSNADSVKMYRNDVFIKEYFPKESKYRNIKYGPMEIDDFIGNTLAQNEKIKPKQAEEIKKALNTIARTGLSHLPASVIWTCAKMILFHGMKPEDAVDLYGKYVGDWGGTSTVYRFEAIKNGEIVKTVVKEPMRKVHLAAQADHYTLKEENSYDVATIRIQARDENENLLNFFDEPVVLKVEGPAELIGPQIITMRGGMGGTYLKTTGKSGIVKLSFMNEQTQTMVIEFQVEV